MKKFVLGAGLVLANSALAGGGGLPQTLAYECAGDSGVQISVLQNDNYFFGSIAVEAPAEGSDEQSSLMKFQGAYDEGDATVFPFGTGTQVVKLFLPLGEVSQVTEVTGSFRGEQLICEGVGFSL